MSIYNAINFSWCIICGKVCVLNWCVCINQIGDFWWNGVMRKKLPWERPWKPEKWNVQQKWSPSCSSDLYSIVFFSLTHSSSSRFILFCKYVIALKYGEMLNTMITEVLLHWNSHFSGFGIFYLFLVQVRYLKFIVSSVSVFRSSPPHFADRYFSGGREKCDGETWEILS